MILTQILMLCAAAIAAPTEVTITKDNTVINTSCKVIIPAGTVIEDADGNGVIQVKGDNITIEFAPGSELRGAPPMTPWDQSKGVGLVIDGGRRVTIKGAAVHGFKVGIRAQKTTGLTIDGADISDNFRQHLKSTPAGEADTDWLSAHNNDKNEWSTNYGAGLLVEDSQQATIKNVKCRNGQNGIMLDRVNDSKIYDNDCSFLSGWGLSMWRSNKNVISRNAFDFCVRGHVEGVYNRGQDSAGILMFEQCSNNTIAENSVTHGGDGFFGFAGAEAIGDTPAPANFAYNRKGCNDNLFLKNDFSYASAHGLELTFSYGNKIIENQFIENAICGIWGGYSQDSIISQNQFTGNGGMAYGLERGAINMEHASGNKIFENKFLNNKVAIHLWWDDDGDLLEKPGVKKNYKGVSGNVIAENEVTINNKHPFGKLPADAVFYAWQFRDAQPKPAAPDSTTPDSDAKAPDGKKPAPKPPAKKDEKKEEHFKNNQLSQNVVLIEEVNGVESQIDPGIEFKTAGSTPKIQTPRAEPLGQTTPVGARAMLAGRAKIVMDEWGPWDHQSPLLRPASTKGSAHIYDLLGAGSGRIEATIQPTSLIVQVDAGLAESPTKLTVTGGNTVTPYTLHVKVPPSFDRTVTGTLIPARWNLTFFPWTDATDPVKELEAWRQLATSPEAKSATTADLALRFGGGGPKDLKLSRAVTDSSIGPNHFGTIATTRIALPPGKWRIWTLSDDGVRVLVGNKPLIENWKWHAPERNEAEFTQDKEGPVDIKVEYFEIDGNAVLEFGLEQVK